jgi:hypothetical protein
MMPTFIPRSSRTPHRFVFALVPAVALWLTGCAGSSSSSSTATNPPAVSSSSVVSGIVMGGPFSIQGATVTLYATQSNGYGGAGLTLATTTSGADGTFSFNPSSYTCPAGQQAYVAAVGGAIGLNTNSPNSILMTAIGPCSSLTAGVSLWIDAPTTVAAAYALDNFISITGNTVNISVPAKNNAATGSCTGTGSTMACVAAGLPHAFLNAQTLVNGVGTSTAPPTGAPNANPPQNPGTADLIASLGTTSNPYTLGNTIPIPVINSLANILEDCVNTSGGVAGDSTNCGTLFLNTTPISTYSASTAVPTNTLQAAMNIARFPFNNIPAIYALAASNNYYQPALTAAPVDWAIAIMYHSIGVNSAASPIGAPFFVALDADDNVSVSANSVGTSPSGAGAAPVVMSQLSSNGAGHWQTSLANSTACATGLTGNLCNEAVDALGNTYLSDVDYLYQLSSSGTATPYTLALNASTTLKPVNVAVDRYNNLFVSSNNTTGTANLATYLAGSATPSAVTANGVSQLLSPIPGGLGFNSNGDMGITLYGSASMRSVVLPNTGTTNSVFGAALNGVMSTTKDTQMEPVLFDSSNNFYTLNLANFYKLPVGLYAGTATGIAGSGGSQMRMGVIDGGGTIWVSDPATTGNKVIRSYYAGLSTPSFGAVTGCLPWGSAATTVTVGAVATTSTPSTLCNPAVWNGGSTAQAPPLGSRNAVVDSSGAIWAGAGTNFGILQLLGAAAPTWPLLSYSKFGVPPQ